MFVYGDVHMAYSPQDRRIVVILTEFASPWKQAWKSSRPGLRLGYIRSASPVSRENFIVI